MTRRRAVKLSSWMRPRGDGGARPGSWTSMGTIAPSTGISGRRLPRPGVWSWFGRWRSNTVIGRGATPVNPDFKDLFAALNDAGVRFLLVGGYALAHHGHPRFTRDLGVWVEAEPENAASLCRARSLRRSSRGSWKRGPGTGGPDLSDRRGPESDRHRHEHRRGHVWGGPGSAEGTSYGGQPVPVIARSHLIANNRASGRPQDLVDLEELGRASGR